MACCAKLKELYTRCKAWRACHPLPPDLPRTPGFPPVLAAAGDPGAPCLLHSGVCVCVCTVAGEVKVGSWKCFFTLIVCQSQFISVDRHGEMDHYIHINWLWHHPRIVFLVSLIKSSTSLLISFHILDSSYFKIWSDINLLSKQIKKNKTKKQAHTGC